MYQLEGDEPVQVPETIFQCETNISSHTRYFYFFRYCPVEAIKVEDKANIDEENCIDCGTCVDECPEGAISVE